MFIGQTIDVRRLVLADGYARLMLMHTLSSLALHASLNVLADIYVVTAASWALPSFISCFVTQQLLRATKMKFKYTLGNEM